MNRKNYANSSGVVIDVCRKHGVWFDMEELDKVLEYIRSGRLLKYQERAARNAKRVRSEKNTSPLISTSFGSNTVHDISSNEDFLSEIVDWIVD